MGCGKPVMRERGGRWLGRTFLEEGIGGGRICQLRVGLRVGRIRCSGKKRC